LKEKQEDLPHPTACLAEAYAKAGPSPRRRWNKRNAGRLRREA